MNTDNLSPAMQKAIEAGGTSNTIIGNALVKRGIFEHGRGLHEHPFVPTAEFLKFDAAMAEHDKPHLTLSASEPREEEFHAVGFSVKPAAEADVAFIAEREQVRTEYEAGEVEAAKTQIELAEHALAGFTLPDADKVIIARGMDTARAYLSTDTPREGVRLARRMVEVWSRVVRLRRDFPSAPEWRKERIRAALATLGTVMYPEGTPEHDSYSQELTAELSQRKTTGEKRYRIEFERIGATDNPKPLYVATFERQAALVEKIRRYAGKFLSSREFSVFADVETGVVEIQGGRFGRGRIVLDS